MIDDINEMRRYIAVLTRSEARAKAFVEELTTTDWTPFFKEYSQKPLVQCDACEAMYMPGNYDILSCHFNLCHDCRDKRGWNTRHALNKENRKFHLNLERARKAGLPATLTFVEWIKTLQHFDWKCAYCQINPYEVLEHFIPIIGGGGTTKGNCIPACKACNSKKWVDNPRSFCLNETLYRIRAYLNQFL